MWTLRLWKKSLNEATRCIRIAKTHDIWSCRDHCNACMCVSCPWKQNKKNSLDESISLYKNLKRKWNSVITITLTITSFIHFYKRLVMKKANFYMPTRNTIHARQLEIHQSNWIICIDGLPEPLTLFLWRPEQLSLQDFESDRIG